MGICPARGGRAQAIGCAVASTCRWVTTRCPTRTRCLRRLAELPVRATRTSSCQSGDTKNFWVVEYGLTQVPAISSPTTAIDAVARSRSGVHEVYEEMRVGGDGPTIEPSPLQRASLWSLDRVVDRSSVLCRCGRRKRERERTRIARQALPMVWDFCEANPFGGASGDVREYLTQTADLIETLAVGQPARCVRGSATSACRSQTRARTRSSPTRLTTTTSLTPTCPTSSMSGSSAASASSTRTTSAVSSRRNATRLWWLRTGTTATRTRPGRSTSS